MTHRLPRCLLIMLLAAAGTLSAGCSTFNRDWKALNEESAPVVGLEGRWSGTWHSDVSDHTGALRCIVTRDDEDVIQARFHATYALGLTFEYSMPMDVQQDGDVLRFSGAADLGALFGEYQCEGTVEGDEFRSTYTSKDDHGTFEMTRVPEVDEDADDQKTEAGGWRPVSGLWSLVSGFHPSRLVARLPCAAGDGGAVVAVGAFAGGFGEDAFAETD